MSHPIVGVWVVEIHYPDRPRTDRGTLLVHGAGTISLAFADFASHAVWRATGDRTAAVTGVRPVGPNEGFTGWFELRATATVSDDGGSCNIPALQTRPRPDGTIIEQQMTITGTRLAIAPD